MLVGWGGPVGKITVAIIYSLYTCHERISKRNRVSMAEKWSDLGSFGLVARLFGKAACSPHRVRQ